MTRATPGAVVKGVNMLKRLSLALALLAAASLVISPVAPAYAASIKSDKAKTEWIAKQAKSGNIAILSTKQMSVLAKANPKLHAKLWAAYQNNTVPNLTTTERKAVAAATTNNLQHFKAGATEWVVVALVVAAILLLIWWWGILRADAPSSTTRLALRRKLVHRRATA
jgi:sensor c-di-GMP phosphodiesterase-like protein